MRRFFVSLMAFAIAFSNVAAPLAARATVNSSSPTFSVTTWKDGQDKIVLTFNQEVANDVDAELDVTDFSVSGTQSISIAAVEHEAFDEEVIVTLSSNLNSANNDFTISCVASSVFGENGTSSCASAVAVGVYTNPEDITGPTVEALDFVSTTELAVEFDEIMDESTFVSGNFTLATSDAADDSAITEVETIGDDVILLVASAANVGFGAGNSVTIGAGVTDLVGNAMTETTETVLPLLVVSEVRLASATNAKDEFIELYNPSDADFDMGTTGSQTVYLHIWDGTTDTELPLTIHASTIASNGFYLIGTSFTEASTSLDAVYSASSVQLGTDDAVYISLSATADTDVIDLVGWGNSTMSEGMPSETPAAGETIERKAMDDSTASGMAEGGEDEFSGNGEDSDDNAEDFVVQAVAVPQSTASLVEFSVGSSFNEGGDDEAPDVYYSYPDAFTTVSDDLETIGVVFTETMDGETLTTTTVSLVTASDPNTNLCESISYDPYSAYGSYSECDILSSALPLDGEETYTFTVTTGATDTNANPLVGEYSFSFVPEEGGSSGSGGAPYVWGSYPYDDQTEFPPNTSYLYLYFSDEMDVTTLTSANIALTNVTDDTDVTIGDITPFFAYTENDSVYIDVSAVDFEEGDEYELTASAAVLSADGVALDPETVAFTIASGEDLTAPVVTGLYPYNGQTDVFVGTETIYVSFDDALDTTTLTTDTVRLLQGADEIPVSLSYNASWGQLEITVDAALEGETEYTVEMTAGPTEGAIANGGGLLLTDDDGTADGTYSFSFTTGEGDTSAPMVYYATATQSSLFVTFTEAMNEDSVETLANYTLESPDGTAVALSALAGNAVSYDSSTQTAELDGLALTAGDSFEVTVTGATDRSGNAIDETADTATGTVYDEATYDPGSHSYSEEEGEMPDGFDESDYGYVAQPSAWPSNSLAGFESSYYIYVPITSQIPSGDAGGQVIVTFPNGTDVSGANAPEWSWSNEDANFDSPGTVAVESVTVNEEARTVTVEFTEATRCDDGNDEPCAGDASDYVYFEIGGVVNPTTPRGYDTEGYSAEVRTMDGNTSLESFISYPYYILEAGSSSLTVNLTAEGAEGGTATMHAWGWSTGSFDFESDEFAGGAAEASMAGVPDGDYWIWTDPMLDLDGDDEDDYVGVASPIYVTVSGDTETDMTFTDVDSLALVTVHVTGAIGKNVDVSAYGPSWTSEQIESTSGDDDVELRLQDGEWWVYVSPHYDDTAGYVTPDYITPSQVYVSVEGGVVAYEDSGTANDGTIEMDLVAVDNEIPFFAVDQDGLPIASAWVWLSDVSGGYWNYGQTAIDGTLTLPVGSGTFRAGLYVEGLPPTEELTIVVDEDGAIFVNGSSTATALVTLEARVPTNVISGTVSDGESPVSGSSVYAFCTDGCVGNSYSWSSTDTNGAFTFYVDNGTWQVGAYIPGYGHAPEQTVVIADGNETGLLLAPDPDAVFYTISGTVCQAEEGADDCTGEDGMANVWMYVWSDEEGGGSNYGTTSSDGTYSLRVPAADGYRIDAWDNELGSLIGLSDVDVSEGDVAGADIVVVDPETVTFRVEDSAGDPYVDGQLFGEAVNVETGGRLHFWIEGTDSTTLNLPPGDYEFDLYSNQAGLGSDDIASDSVDTVFTDGVLTVDGEEALVLTMPELFTLSGTVTDGDGAPVVSAWVEIMDNGTDMYTGAVTDETGAYSIELEAGTYQGMVYYPGLVIDPAEVTVDGDTTADFSGEVADRTISGTITADDTGVPYAYVMGEDSDGTVAGAQADADGAFELWVTDETWTLTAVGYGYDEGEGVDVEVDGEDVAGVALTLGAAVELSDPLSVSVTPSAGGLVQNDDAGIEIVVPENALGTSSTSSNAVTVTETNNVIDTGTSTVIGNGIEVDVTDSNGSAITQFNDDLTYTWTMTVEELATEGIDTQAEVEELTISYYDSTGSWIAGATTVTYYAADDSVVSDPADDLSDVSYVELVAAFDHTTLFAVTTSSGEDSDDSEEESEDDDDNGGGGGGGGGSSRSSSSDDDEDEDEDEEESESEADDDDGDDDSEDSDDEDEDEDDERDEQIASILSEADEDEYLSDAAAMAEMVSAARDVLAEFATIQMLVVKVTMGGMLPSDITDYRSLVNFVTYGTPVTVKLGSGERAGVVNSFQSAFGRLPESDDDWADTLKIAVGRWPTQRSETSETAAATTFQTIYLRAADMANPNDNAAVTVMSYGLRPSSRSLASEAVAIGYFEAIFGHAPSSASDWDTVRAIAYSGATR